MGKPAARMGDMTAHGGTIILGKPTVLIGKMPAATMGDQHVCPMVTGVVPHVGGPITLGSTGVLISKMPAARLSDITVCVGPPSMPVMGEFTVLIGEAGSGSNAASAASAAAAASSAKNGPAAITPFDVAEPPEPRTENHWVEVEVTDSAGLPLGGVRYKMKDPAGNDVVGATSTEGRIRHDGYVQAGSFKVDLQIVSNAKWSKTEAKPGDELTLKADAEVFQDGTPATVLVFEERDGGRFRRVIGKIATKVSGNKIEAKWKLAKEDYPEAPSKAGEDQKPMGRAEYYFLAEAESVVAYSDRAIFNDTAEIKLLDENGDPVKEAGYEMHLHDGTIRKGKLDKDGKATEKDVPVGPYVIVLPEIVITARSPKAKEKEKEKEKPETAAPGAEPPWIPVARAELGVKEFEKARHNKRILEYHASTTLKAKDDETPWCSAFVNWVMTQSGYKGTNSALALSWAQWGRKIDKPALGAIGVIDWHAANPKKKAGSGHVGFVVGEAPDGLILLGGNQGDMVQLGKFAAKLFKAFVLPKDFTGESYELPKLGKHMKLADFAKTR